MFYKKETQGINQYCLHFGLRIELNIAKIFGLNNFQFQINYQYSLNYEQQNVTTE